MHLSVRYFLHPSPRLLHSGIPAAMLFVAAVFGPQPKDTPLVRFLTYAGDSSYALYLSHPFSIGVVMILAGRIGGLSALPVFVLLVVVSVLASLAIYTLVERPFLAWARSRRSRGALPVAAVPTPAPALAPVRPGETGTA
jgi:peptidoglycan/LPS O-acetylase OafA/YrhL